MSNAPSPFSTQHPWDQVAAGYSAERALVMEPFSLAAIERMQELVPHALAPGGRVVDVAAGPGTLSIPVARRGAEVHALDFSPAMLAELEAARARHGLDNVRALHGDGMALPYADASFDAAFSLFGLMFFPDRLQGFRELFRVLVPGGAVLVSSWVPAEQSPLMALMFGALTAADPSLPPPLRNLTSLENPEVFEAELLQAGFVDVVIQPHTHAVPALSAEEFWIKMTRSSAPLLLMRERLGEEEWSRRSLDSQAYLREQFAGGLRDVEVTALFGTGRRPAQSGT